jgi:hypothetical protein
MDVRGIKNWAQEVACKLLESGNEGKKLLDRFLVDLRSANLPHEFANTLVNSITVFGKRGIEIEIHDDLQYFDNITKFKQIKAIVIAVLHNERIRREKFSRSAGGSENEEGVNIHPNEGEG